MSRTKADRAAPNDPVAELASGIDALYLSGRGTLRAELVEELAHQRDLAEAGLPAGMALGALPFAMSSRPWGKYRYCLEHPIGRVGFSESRHLPAIRVQPRSEFLHAVGPGQAVMLLTDLLEPLAPDLSFGVSRIDLYTDVTGFPLGLDQHDRFLCRATSRRTYEVDGEVSGFDFGSRKGATVCARVYDKTLDVDRTGKDWWYEIWGEEHDPNDRVTRVELEIGRQALSSDFDLDGPSSVLEAVLGLWRYGAGEWLTHREPTADSNPTRWPLSRQWQVVQGARFEGAAVSLERLQQRGRAGSMRKLTPGLIGYLVAFGVQARTHDIDDTLRALDGHIRNDEIVRRKSFSERIEQRRLEAGRP